MYGYGSLGHSAAVGRLQESSEDGWPRQLYIVEILQAGRDGRPERGLFELFSRGQLVDTLGEFSLCLIAVTAFGFANLIPNVFLRM